MEHKELRYKTQQKNTTGRLGERGRTTAKHTTSVSLDFYTIRVYTISQQEPSTKHTQNTNRHAKQTEGGPRKDRNKTNVR